MCNDDVVMIVETGDGQTKESLKRGADFDIECCKYAKRLKGILGWVKDPKQTTNIIICE